MNLYLRLIKNSFKTQMSFRADFVLETLFSFLWLMLSINIWTALYSARSEQSIVEIGLKEQIVYSIVAVIVKSLTTCNVMNELNDMVLNGEISQRLLLPLGFRKHLFFQTVSNNIFLFIYSAIPPVVIAVLIYQIHFICDIQNLLICVLSVILSYTLNFFLNFVLGLTVFWFRNAFFLSWMTSAFFSLFSGSFVPVWFFPQWLNKVSLFIPYRYIVFEPTAILLGRYDISTSLKIVIVQLIWIVILYVIGEIIWRIGRKKLMVQGG